MKPFFLAAAAALAALTAPGTSGAAVITRSSPQNVTGDSDVRTNGTPVGSYNFDTGPATTVNGVTFIGVNPTVITTFGNFTVAPALVTGTIFGSPPRSPTGLPPTNCC